MKRLRRCKIIATLGPVSSTKEAIAALWAAGADVFRINMSHSDHAGLRERTRLIREVEFEVGRSIAILADLQGPKLRLGQFAESAVELVHGASFTLDSDPTPGNAKRVQLPHPEILAALRLGHRMLIDDGRVALHVIEADAQHATTLVDIAGKVSNRKGVCLPDTEIAVSAMTTKDRSDLEAALDAGADWIALSFVQKPEDVAEVKKVTGGRALIMSKIEKPQAIARLDEIMELSDGLMVARGDLGVEMPLEKVPGLQKRITRMARRLGKPVVVATQMLESMINLPVPTRAEVSDVATAVFEGADAVMLSAESASGQYSTEAVAMMNRIAIEVETDSVYRSIIAAQRAEPERTAADAIAIAAREMSETLDIRALVAWTSSGSTALRISRERAEAPLLALTPNVETARRLVLAWGVHAVVTEDAHDIDDMAVRACQWAKREGLAGAGERILIVAGVPFGTPGATNMIRVAFVS